MTGHLPNEHNVKLNSLNEVEGEDVKWVEILHANDDFTVPIRGMMINNHLMNGSSSHTTAFIDSGTTFTYMNTESYNAIKLHL